MSMPQLTDAAQREQEAQWERERRMRDLLIVIAAEFKSDPTSTQCLDSRIVDEAIKLAAEHEAAVRRNPYRFA